MALRIPHPLVIELTVDIFADPSLEAMPPSTVYGAAETPSCYRQPRAYIRALAGLKDISKPRDFRVDSIDTSRCRNTLPCPHQDLMSLLTKAL
jgi:hypothetical protein